MIFYKKPFLLLLLFGLGVSFAGHGQIKAINDIEKEFREYCDQSLKEKVFVHLDRTYFLTGESLWFKLYIANGSSHHLQDLSKVCLLEILDKENKPVVQTKVAVEEGLGKGNIYLPLTLKSGHYTFRAYTNWMKNFDPAYYFEENITIVNSFVKPEFSPGDNKTAFDIQFFPEGGNLVAGIPSKVAFRAVDQSGKGINFEGALLNSANDTVALFEPTKFGIGHFSFKPLENEVYHTVVTTAGDSVLSGVFPASHRRGYVMTLSDTTDERLRLKVTSNVNSEEYLYLLIHTRQKAVFAEGKKTEDGRTEFLVDRSKLGDGISHITLFDYQKRPVCERLYFKYPPFLTLNAQPEKKSYAFRKKVNIQLTLEEAEDSLQSNLSVAVFLLDSLNQKDVKNISSYLWLTSDLKGKIESPDYYFEGQNPAIKQAMDDLMLSHGWRRFSWGDVFGDNRPALEYIPEYEGHTVKATISDKQTGEPVKNVATFLSVPGKSGHFYGSRSDETGTLFFVTQNFYGARDIILQHNPVINRQLQLKVLSPFSDSFTENPYPAPFILSENVRESLRDRHKFMQTQNLYWSRELNSIDTSVLETQDFYGYADQTYLLDDYTRFPTMEEVMREYVAEVIVRKKDNDFYFRVVKAQQEIHNDNPLVLLNNVPVFDINRIISYNPLYVKKIGIVKDGYILGGAIPLKGIVSYTTYDGQMKGFELDPSILQQSYDGLQIPKEFYSPMYGDNLSVSDPRPDFRNLLYWNPVVKLNSGKPITLDFYTSDVTGKYLGIIQGMTKDGTTGFETFSFTVEEPVN